MESTERLLGELAEFKRVTVEKLTKIEEKVDALDQFRWKAAGVLACIAIGAEKLFQFVLKG